ncbi:hypothetical protein VIGAN_11174400 [Vigna angularis var. angularis]|nr:hypothetical protein VIGAN_11174400 [Vigna angularis var. angularis]
MERSSRIVNGDGETVMDEWETMAMVLSNFERESIESAKTFPKPGERRGRAAAAVKRLGFFTESFGCGLWKGEE